MDPLLQIVNLDKTFGGLRAVSNFDLEVYPGELVGLIGPNGAGKTTVFNMITGVYTPTQGQILYQGQNIGGMAPHEVTQMGIARTFQNIRLFPSLSVLDNVRIAYHHHAGYGIRESILRPPSFDRLERELTERTQEFLAVFNLHTRQDEIALTCLTASNAGWRLPRAGKQSEATPPGRAGRGHEPGGDHPPDGADHFIRDRFNLTILLIEHQMRLVMNICERLTVMDFGR